MAAACGDTRVATLEPEDFNSIASGLLTAEALQRQLLQTPNSATTRQLYVEQFSAHKGSCSVVQHYAQCYLTASSS